jgi:hypothetical protein
MTSRHRQDGVSPKCPRTRPTGPKRFGAQGRSYGGDRRV